MVMRTLGTDLRDRQTCQNKSEKTGNKGDSPVIGLDKPDELGSKTASSESLEVMR